MTVGAGEGAGGGEGWGDVSLAARASGSGGGASDPDGESTSIARGGYGGGKSSGATAAATSTVTATSVAARPNVFFIVSTWLSKGTLAATLDDGAPDPFRSAGGGDACMEGARMGDDGWAAEGGAGPFADDGRRRDVKAVSGPLRTYSGPLGSSGGAPASAAAASHTRYRLSSGWLDRPTPAPTSSHGSNVGRQGRRGGGEGGGAATELSPLASFARAVTPPPRDYDARDYDGGGVVLGAGGTAHKSGSHTDDELELELEAEPPASPVRSVERHHHIDPAHMFTTFHSHSVHMFTTVRSHSIYVWSHSMHIPFTCGDIPCTFRSHPVQFQLYGHLKPCWSARPNNWPAHPNC
jgi:hypothetical protein